ncbi:tripartite motif-containing protein 2-like isoform X2 [Anneissia japonica]|nr:tripartite motif-containing protein 2-like isoform X2 [Anneissia japonica]XP_033097410.1 tripartite motif-containing protein 2-like isoform X2 [Anneissia japonica]
MATENTFKAEDLDRQFLQCTLCLDRLTKPKVLPCQHTFCEGCLELWVDRNEGLTCPVCRKDYPLPANGVVGLPDNFFINNIIDFISLKKECEENSTACHGCERTASNYCTVCLEFLCSDCGSAHRRLRLTRNHRVQSMDEYRSSQAMPAARIRILSPDHCPDHPEYEIQFYCQTCERVICRKCCATLHPLPVHRQLSIESAAESRRSYMTSMIDKAQSKAQKASETLYGLRKIKENLDVSREKHINKIRQRKEFLTGVIERHEEKMMDEYNDFFNERSSEIEEEISKFVEIVDEIDSINSVTESLLEGGKEVALMTQSLQSTVKLQRVLQTDVETQITDEPSIGFVAGEDDLNESEIFGKIEKNETKIYRTVFNSEAPPPQVVAVGENVQFTLQMDDLVERNEINAQPIPVSAKLCSPTGEVGIARVSNKDNGNYDVTFRPISEGRHRLILSVLGRQLSESPYYIDVSSSTTHRLKFGDGDGGDSGCLREPWGVCMFGEKHVLIADTGNNAIRIFDIDGRYKTHLCFPSLEKNLEPTDIVTTGDGVIYVSDAGNCQVIVCDIEGHLLGRFGKNVLKKPCGLALSLSGNVCVVDHELHTVKVFTARGQHIHDIGYNGNGRGQFRGPLSATVNTKDELIVSDRENHRLQVFNKDGHFLKELILSQDGEALKYPSGICTDKDDNLYVCNDWNNRILKFTSDGNFICRIDNEVDRLKYPNGVCISKDGSKLIVVDYGNDCAKLFDL